MPSSKAVKMKFANKDNSYTKCYKYFKDVNQNMDVICGQIWKPSSAIKAIKKTDGRSISENSFD